MLRRLADQRLRRENERLTEELEAERRRLRVAEAEIKHLWAIVARNLARTKAEMSECALKIAETEPDA